MTSEQIYKYGLSMPDRFVQFVSDNGVQVYAVGVTAICIGIGLFIYERWTRPGEPDMVTRGDYILSKRQRRLRQNEKVSDGISNLMLKLYADGEVTEDDYNRWIDRFARRLGLRDLQPRKMNTEQLKLAIRHRTRNGYYKPVPFFKYKETARKPKNKLDEVLNSAK